ncbi:amino acid transporter [Colletotrichum truncatum]|uniref:Amino acid transporter n=1 Tax=Colletotrichum truncatum TaxID=5467 RepID=A0ACC3YBN5_COLTU|nr:amino acid transporter [Colletotrichum truncatum]KAF6781462.1 amino acid transporter [Colletotrichum truncatum]
MVISDIEATNDSEKMKDPVPHHHEDIATVPVTEQDAVFGELSENGPNYRSVGWLGTAGLMMKTQLGLGILSFPSVFDTLGMIPGIILLLTIATITTWSDYIVGVFKLNHPQVYGVDDAGQLMFGRIGKEAFAIAFMGQYVLTAGSAMLSLSISLNALSSHGTCTATFVGVAFVMIFLLSSIRTLGRITWVAWVGLAGILTAVFMVTIAVGVKGGPPNVPQGVVWESDYKLFGNPSFTEAMSAVATLIFAYAGTGAFFPIVAEMRDPSKYTRALALCQTVVTVAFIIVAIVIYYYCGSQVASPALGTAGPLIKKIAYGIAFPGLLASGCILAHVSSKYVFVRVLRGSRHLTSNTVTHWISWIGCTFCVSLIAYILASAIPVFNGLVSLCGALFGTLLSFQPMGCMWLYDNWRSGREKPTARWYLGVAWSVFVITAGTFLMIGGTYSTIVGIIDSFHAEGGSSVWSCADNSNSS